VRTFSRLLAPRLALIVGVLNHLDPETRKKVSEFLQTGPQVADLRQMEPEAVIQKTAATGLLNYKPGMLEILLLRLRSARGCAGRIFQNLRTYNSETQVNKTALKSNPGTRFSAILSLQSTLDEGEQQPCRKQGSTKPYFTVSR
jgi:hypothetical protein